MEGLPELAQDRLPVRLPPGDGVQLVLQAGGEVIVHVVGEMSGQEPAHHPPHVGEVKALFGQLGVAPVLQGGQDRGIGGGSADTEGLQLLDQRGLVVAGWRLGEMLLGPDLPQPGPVALGQRGQPGLLLLAGIVPALLVDLEEAGEGNG